MTHAYDVRVGAFTLTELLVSMGILVLLVALISAMFNQTNLAVRAATKQLDVSGQARMALDRIGTNLNNMVVAQGIAPVVLKDSGDATSGTLNDGLAFITNSRPRSRSSVQEATPSPSPSFIRMAMMAYRVLPLSESAFLSSPIPNPTPSPVPMLNWGDGTVSWSTASTLAVQNAQYAKSSLPTVISGAATDLATLGSSFPTPVPKMLQFGGIAANIFRFEICFLQDDGTIVATPPRDKNFAAITGNTYPVALSKITSADPNQRYVKAFIIGLAGLDTQTRRLVGTNGDRLKNLADALPNPAATNQTPLQAWDFTSNSTAATTLRNALQANYPLPVINFLRLYQRYFYVANN